MASKDTIRIAAIQMIAELSPVQERLARAEALVAQAAQDGADLAVLPEVFNTGYEYSDENYLLAETFDGPTARWMKRAARHYRVYLAGSFLRWDEGDIYNTLLLVAPDGASWYYDKNYPWVWERAYFRPGTGITVADTKVGRLGMLICWDTAHPRLWQRYAGKVDAMVISSCPPRVHDLRLILPDGRYIPSEETGPLMRHMKRRAGETFGLYLRRQAGHLGVPVVNTTGTGVFHTAMPRPGVSLSVYFLFRPDLWRYAFRAEEVRVESGYFQETYVADAEGQVLARVPAGVEGVALADVRTSERAPQPAGRPPRFGLPVFAYLLDVFANALLVSVYRKGVRSAHRFNEEDKTYGS